MTLAAPDHIILIAGPTASGKSALVLNLAERLAGKGMVCEIVNADSMQVYAELSVLTARPTAEDEARIPHRLYGHVSLREGYSAGRWLGEVEQALADILKQGKRAFVVGGTGLYFRALVQGLVEVPEIDPEIRAEVRRISEEDSTRAWELLREEDAGVAKTLFPNDKQRIARALEVIRSTGKSLAYWQQHPHKSPLLSLIGTTDVPRFVLNPPRRLVYERCEDRLAQMIRDGALEEVEALPDGLPADLPALKALGVPEIRAYLAGTMELAEAQALVATGTRQFAKRQMTWFRNQFSDWDFLWEQESEKIIEKIVNKIT